MSERLHWTDWRTRWTKRIEIRAKANQSWPLHLGNLDFKKVKAVEAPLKLIKFFLLFLASSQFEAKRLIWLWYTWIRAQVALGWVRKSKQKVKTMLLVDLNLQFFRYGNIIFYFVWQNNNKLVFNLYYFFYIYAQFWPILAILWNKTNFSAWNFEKKQENCSNRQKNDSVRPLTSLFLQIIFCK